MTSVDVMDHEGTVTASVALPADVFDTQANIALMHQVVVAQLAAARQGTHKTKTRGEVAGGGRKPYKQKGTGRARQGSTRAPQFTGGGVVHGPVPRDYTQRVNKKMKVAALRGALSDRARAGVVHVVDSFVTGDTPRTKDALDALNNITDSRKVLVVLGVEDELNWLSLRNLAHVHLIEATQLNTYDVLNSDAVVFSSAALDEFLGVPAERTEVKTVSTKKKSAKDDDESEDDEPKSAKAKSKAKDTKSKDAKAKSEAEVEDVDDEAAADDEAADVADVDAETDVDDGTEGEDEK
jgi:large subunit ribosomal protein L4